MGGNGTTSSLAKACVQCHEGLLWLAAAQHRLLLGHGSTRAVRETRALRIVAIAPPKTVDTSII